MNIEENIDYIFLNILKYYQKSNLDAIVINFDNTPNDRLLFEIIRENIEKFKYDGEGSRVSLDGESEIPVVPLDEIVKGEKISFIKLDIEGCELDCLMGAEVVIQTCRPVIAVCVYHKPEDIIDIMQYLRSVLTEYRFYLRHYSISAMDTVLYAVPEERWRKQYE